MQICSTTLLPCTSSNSRKDLWSCYRCKSHANTLLQNLKKRHSKLLPVYVSQDIKLHFIISLPFFQKNILSAMLVQICSTTLRFCTSSNVQIGIWSCYRRKSLANTLLQNCILNIHFFVLSFTTLWIYTTPKLMVNHISCFFEFYYPMNLHYSKTSKEDWSCYQCMYHRASNYILSHHLSLCQERIILIVTTSKKDLNACVRYL